MTNLLWIVGGFAVAGFLAFVFWNKIGGFFRDSETLFWGRLQMAAGAVFSVLAVTDLTPIFHAFDLGKWAPVYLVISGLVTELARRSRATDL